MISVGVSHSKKGTSYNLSFTVQLNATSATNPALYQVFGAVTKVVHKHKMTLYIKLQRIKSVAYDSGNNMVTITLAKPYKARVLVIINPGLEAATGATSSQPTTLFAP